jgi:hypothetical protein
MEPTGIEPVTSCLQTSRSRAQLRLLKVDYLRGFLATVLGADARGLAAIIAVSGTFGDKCLKIAGRDAAGLAASPPVVSRRIVRDTASASVRNGFARPVGMSARAGLPCHERCIRGRTEPGDPVGFPAISTRGDPEGALEGLPK